MRWPGHRELYLQSNMEYDHSSKNKLLKIIEATMFNITMQLNLKKNLLMY